MNKYGRVYTQEEHKMAHSPKTEWIRAVDCRKCKNWEEMPADMPRHKMQTFELVCITLDGRAKYKCLTCGRSTYSKRKRKEI